MVKIITISATDKAEKIFSEFKKNLPERESFSGSIAVAVDDYMARHKHDSTKISDFVQKGIVITPNMFASIDVWKMNVLKMSHEERKKLHKRLWQLTNLVEKVGI